MSFFWPKEEEDRKGSDVRLENICFRIGPFCGCYSGIGENRRQEYFIQIVEAQEVMDKQKYGEYIQKVPQTIEQFGGKYLTRGGGELT